VLFFKTVILSQVQWCDSVVPATQEAKDPGSLEFKTSLGKTARPHLKNQNKMNLL
jgi:hypothetical protein